MTTKFDVKRLATEFGIPSDDVVAMLRSLEIVVRSPAMPLTDDQVARARTRWEREKRARAAHPPATNASADRRRRAPSAATADASSHTAGKATAKVASKAAPKTTAKAAAKAAPPTAAKATPTSKASAARRSAQGADVVAEAIAPPADADKPTTRRRKGAAFAAQAAAEEAAVQAAAAEAAAEAAAAAAAEAAAAAAAAAAQAAVEAEARARARAMAAPADPPQQAHATPPAPSASATPATAGPADGRITGEPPVPYAAPLFGAPIPGASVPVGALAPRVPARPRPRPIVPGAPRQRPGVSGLPFPPRPIASAAPGVPGDRKSVV